jgi:hypothetical protein
MASDFVQYFSGPNLGKEFYQKKITEENGRVIIGQLFEALANELLDQAEPATGHVECIDAKAKGKLFEIKGAKRPFILDKGQLERYLDWQNERFESIYYVLFCYEGMSGPGEGAKIWDYIETVCASTTRCIIVPVNMVHDAGFKCLHYGKWAIPGREYYFRMREYQFDHMAHGYSNRIFHDQPVLYRVKQFNFLHWKVNPFFAEVYHDDHILGRRARLCQ